MAGVLGRSLFFVLLLAFALPARADPVLMFLFGMAKEIITQAQAKPAGPAPASVSEPAPKWVYPGTIIEPGLLKRLIDDSFLYLTPAQREEVFLALHAELMKPANFAIRAPMIQQFIERCLQVRAAQLQLAKLSSSQKESLAAEFGKEVKAMPPEELPPLREVLEKRLLPVPADLNDLLLAQLG